MLITLSEAARKNGKPMYKIIKIKLFDYINMILTHEDTKNKTKTTIVKIPL